MGKINKLINGLKMLINNPALLNLIIDDEDFHKKEIIKKYKLESGLNEINFFDLLNDKKIEINKFAFLDGGSLPTDLSLIQLIALKINAENYFEIGTWRGESVCAARQIVKNCTTFNLSKLQMQERNWNQQYIDLHGYFSRNDSSIIHLEGDSRKFNFKDYFNSQDLVFIDGDHHFDSVVNDTKVAFQLIKKNKGAIIWHDYAHSPENVRWNVLHAIIEGTPKEFRNNLVAVSNTLCCAFLPFYLETTKRNYPKIPKQFFSIELTSNAQ
jgi:predicted O-methyltransferase YrrM